MCAPPLQQEKQPVIRGTQSSVATGHCQILDTFFVFSITHQYGKNTDCPLHQSTVRSECSLCQQFLSLSSMTQVQCLVPAASLNNRFKITASTCFTNTHTILFITLLHSLLYKPLPFLQETYHLFFFYKRPMKKPKLNYTS